MSEASDFAGEEGKKSFEKNEKSRIRHVGT